MRPPRKLSPLSARVPPSASDNTQSHRSPVLEAVRALNQPIVLKTELGDRHGTFVPVSPPCDQVCVMRLKLDRRPTRHTIVLTPDGDNRVVVCLDGSLNGMPPAMFVFNALNGERDSRLPDYTLELLPSKDSAKSAEELVTTGMF